MNAESSQKTRASTFLLISSRNFSARSVSAGLIRKHTIPSDTGVRSTIKLRKQQIYSEFVDRLWKTAGVRLLTEMLEELRAGKRYRFGTAIVTDYGVDLERRKLFSAKERVPCKWTDLVIGNGDGTFYITKKDEKKVAVELPYQDIDNVHILEAAMRAFWKSASPQLITRYCSLSNLCRRAALNLCGI